MDLRQWILEGVARLGFGERSRRRDEPAIKVFVSSRQTPDLVSLRETVATALRGMPYVEPWIFEYTPASPYPPEQIYVPKVIDSHIVIWIVRNETSDPVRREVLTAIAHDKPLLIFALGAGPRSDEVDDLMRRARERATTKDIATDADLPGEVVAAVRHDVVRRYTGAPAPSRATMLRGLGLQSRERSIIRWETAGLSSALATALADDPAIGAELPGGLIPGEVHVVVGDLGAGKSLLAERTYRGAITAALASPVAPVPVFVHAAELHSGLQVAVMGAAAGIGDPGVVGARIVIDGANEPDAMRPDRLLLEARTLARSWPNTSALIASQPIAAFAEDPGRVDAPLLDDSQAQSLIERIAGAPIDLEFLDDKLKSALHVPLFALLYAQWRSDPERPAFATRAELVQWLVTRALRNHEGTSLDLERLASLAIGERGEVSAADIGTLDQQRDLLRTGLVRKTESGALRFGLPVLTDWFAGQYLIRAEANRRQLLAPTAFAARDVWRDAVALALVSASASVFRELAASLIRADPGYAMRVLTEALEVWGDARVEGVPARAYGEDIQRAREAWMLGLGALGPRVVRSDRGAPVAIAVGLEDRLLIVLEARPGYIEPGSVSDLPDPVDRWVWPRMLRTVPGARLWSWENTLREVRKDLGKLVEARALWAASSDIQRREAAWAAAVKLTQGNLLTREVALDRVRSALPEGAEVVTVALGPRLDVPVTLVAEEVTALQSRSARVIAEPWPAHDAAVGGYTWSGFTPAQLLRRAERVYDGAVQIYLALVREWFSTLTPRLWHASMLPARFVGVIRVPPQAVTFEDEPTLALAIVPLPASESSRVEFYLRGDQGDRGPIAGLEDALEVSGPDALFELMSDQIRRHRPGRTDLGASYMPSGGLQVYGRMPANELAWSWLASDLRLLRIDSTGYFPRTI